MPLVATTNRRLWSRRRRTYTWAIVAPPSSSLRIFLALRRLLWSKRKSSQKVCWCKFLLQRWPLSLYLLYCMLSTVVGLIELFDSEDPRERDYLKTILHRIYGKFMSHRSFIRKTISNVFYRFVYETERHNGVGELLEILGSIINGFAIPLKREHLQFLQYALIPLHIPKCVTLYHQQLSYCVIQFVEKDPDTAVPILNGLIRYWPWSSSAKQVLVMNELEEILELLGHEPLLVVRDTLFELVGFCVKHI